MRFPRARHSVGTVAPAGSTGTFDVSCGDSQDRAPSQALRGCAVASLSRKIVNTAASPAQACWSDYVASQGPDTPRAYKTSCACPSPFPDGQQRWGACFVVGDPQRRRHRCRSDETCRPARSHEDSSFPPGFHPPSRSSYHGEDDTLTPLPGFDDLKRPTTLIRE